MATATIDSRLFEFLTPLTFGALRRNHCQQHSRPSQKKKEGSLSTCDQQCIMNCQCAQPKLEGNVAWKKKISRPWRFKNNDVCNRTQITPLRIYLHYGFELIQQIHRHKITVVTDLIYSQTINLHYVSSATISAEMGWPQVEVVSGSRVGPRQPGLCTMASRRTSDQGAFQRAEYSQSVCKLRRQPNWTTKTWWISLPANQTRRIRNPIDGSLAKKRFSQNHS